MNPPGSYVLEILQAGTLDTGSYSILQGIFLTQGFNPLLHCRKILYRLSHHTREAQ